MAHTAESLQAAFKYLFLDEIPFLKRLAQSLPENPTVVNIGAGAGTSTLAFLESRADLFLYSVDIQRESSPFGSLEGEAKVLADAGLFLPRRIYQYEMDSKVLGIAWDKGPVDMVLVDGDHSYEGCAGDIQAWLPHIMPGGIIAVHDYKKAELYAHDKDFQPDKPHPKPWPDVDKAVDNLLVGKYKLIERVDSLIAFRI